MNINGVRYFSVALRSIAAFVVMAAAVSGCSLRILKIKPKMPPDAVGAESFLITRKLTTVAAGAGCSESPMLEITLNPAVSVPSGRYFIVLQKSGSDWPLWIPVRVGADQAMGAVASDVMVWSGSSGLESSLSPNASAIYLGGQQKSTSVTVTDCSLQLQEIEIEVLRSPDFFVVDDDSKDHTLNCIPGKPVTFKVAMDQENLPPVGEYDIIITADDDHGAWSSKSIPLLVRRGTSATLSAGHVATSESECATDDHGKCSEYPPKITASIVSGSTVMDDIHGMLRIQVNCESLVTLDLSVDPYDPANSL